MFSWRTHPEDGHLLRFCEGELRAHEVARIERHVRGCWECRTHIDDIRRTITEYVRYRQELLQPGLPPPPAPWVNLSRELHRVRDQETNGPRFIALRRPLAWIFAGLAALAVSAAAVYLTRPIPHAVPVSPAIHEPKRAEPPEHRDLAAVQSKAAAEAVQNHSRSEPIGPEDELRVIAALHQIGADLGDPVAVVRKRDQIVVNGTGLELKRAQQVRASVADLPRVSFEFTAPRPNPVELSSPVTKSERSSPIQAEIARQFGDPVTYQRFVDHTLESSDAMMARAHALRSLADRFSPDAEGQLSASGLKLLASLRDQHAAALVDDVQAIDSSLRPVLGALGASAKPRESPAAANWQDAVYELFATAQKLDRLVGVMLAATSSDSLTDSTPAEAAAALVQLKTSISSYQHFSADGQTKGGR
jgi:hypothetical protein